MKPADLSRFAEMKMVLHLIDEFKKGFAVWSCAPCARPAPGSSWNGWTIRGSVTSPQKVGNRNVNLFFGEQVCLAAVGQFIHKPLNKLTPEEDFMLGAMLGYDLAKQCRRYGDRKLKAQGIS